jgi:hypothetical protein
MKPEDTTSPEKLLGEQKTKMLHTQRALFGGKPRTTEREIIATRT